MRNWTGLFMVILAVAQPSLAQAQRIPIRVVIQRGWETNVHALAPVSADSDIGREFPNERMVVGFAYDQYWFVIPIWNSRGSYVICKEFKDPEKPDRHLVLREQNVERDSSELGVPKDQLRKPLLYYIPPGWIVFAAIVFVVKITSGPGPQKRFRRLWIDPRYRTAIAKLLDVEKSDLPTDFETIVLRGSLRIRRPSSTRWSLGWANRGQAAAKPPATLITCCGI